MDSLVTGHDRVLVRQVKEWAEILVNFETRNRFELLTETGETIGYAAEEGSGFLTVMARNFLGKLRAAKVHIYDSTRNEVGVGQKEFRWYFHRMNVFEGGRQIGAIQRRFAFFHRIYSVENAAGMEVLTIKSPFFRIWTFMLFDGEREIGRISKKWGGLLREAFTDADTFGVEFPSEKMGMELRKILLLATFLIDFAHFENNRKN